jgi:hypothetical protein
VSSETETQLILRFLLRYCFSPRSSKKCLIPSQLSSGNMVLNHCPLECCGTSGSLASRKLLYQMNNLTSFAASSLLFHSLAGCLCLKPVLRRTLALKVHLPFSSVKDDAIPKTVPSRCFRVLQIASFYKLIPISYSW